MQPIVSSSTIWVYNCMHDAAHHQLRQSCISIHIQHEFQRKPCAHMHKYISINVRKYEAPQHQFPLQSSAMSNTSTHRMHCTCRHTLIHENKVQQAAHPETGDRWPSVAGPTLSMSCRTRPFHSPVSGSRTPYRPSGFNVMV